jgi:hypothetical protein
MELLLPAPARAPQEPDPTATGPEPSAPTGSGAESEPAHHRVADEPYEPDEPVTDKGLPKRTPKITTPSSAPRPRTGSVDAEALRRRLGGFHRGAEAGRRDVEAEIAEQTTQTQAPTTGTARPATSEEATGGTVEEATS